MQASAGAAEQEARSRAGKIFTTVVPGAQGEARRNNVETETNKDKSSSCDVVVTREDVRCFLQTVLKIELVLCDL